MKYRNSSASQLQAIQSFLKKATGKMRSANGNAYLAEPKIPEKGLKQLSIYNHNTACDIENTCLKIIKFVDRFVALSGFLIDIISAIKLHPHIFIRFVYLGDSG